MPGGFQWEWLAGLRSRRGGWSLDILAARTVSSLEQGLGLTQLSFSTTHANTPKPWHMDLQMDSLLAQSLRGPDSTLQ